jgi:hypothetical protein
MKEIDFAYRTLFAELSQRCLDAAFQSDFPLDGRFVTVPVKGRGYWYFDQRQDDRVLRRYVGPHSDPEIAKRVEAFREIKDDLKARRKLVSTLTREAGLPVPERFTGDIVEALADAGFFRVRGVLVGTVAFQCYSGLLGVRLPSASLQTGDADFAQFHSISAAVDDSILPALELIRKVDPTFREVPHQLDSRFSTAFENKTRFRVEFLTPNRGGADHEGQPTEMPALGGAAAQPLRFLDFLIYEPVRSLMLHRNGVAVTVPAPERYAVHKLIVASRRRADGGSSLKRDKDIRQADLLVEALATTRRQSDLALVFAEAWKRGPAWREAIAMGMTYLPATRAGQMREILSVGLRDIGENPDHYGTATATS